MDPTYITKIIAAGAMGVSIFCVLRVYDLLKKEQSESSPRPVILKSIYIFMAFGIIMTLLSLGIEFIRHNYISDEENPCASYQKDLTDLVQDLHDITTTREYFSVNKNGNPEAITLKYNNQDYVLSKAFPESVFENTPLVLKKTPTEKYIAVKDNNGKETVFGYINEANLKSFFPASSIYNEDKPEGLFSLGVFYMPVSTLQVIKEDLKKRKNKYIANEKLIALIKLKNSDKALQEAALKLLTQPESMNALDSSQYKNLIAAYESGEIREAPWYKYELAQIYLSRSWKSWSSNKGADIAKYKQFLKEYIDSYESQEWISGNPSVYHIEYNWYEAAKEELNL